MESTEAKCYIFHDDDLSRMDDEIVAALKEEFEYTLGKDFLFEFYMHEDEFYDVLSIIDAHNAPALIQVGLRDKSAVRDFLLRHDLHHLIHNNAEAVETAQRSNVTIEDYMELYSAARWSHRHAYDDLIRGLETYKELVDYRFCRKTLLPLIVRGLLTYEDVEKIGYRTLERSSNRTMIVSALMALRDKERVVEVTAEHIKRALEDGLVTEAEGLDDLQRLTAKVDGRLHLLVTFGGEASLKFQCPAAVYHTIQQQWRAYHKRIELDFAMFIDEMSAMMVTSSAMPAVAEMELLFEAGVESAFAAEKIKNDPDWTVNRIIALHAGAASALTGGWL